MSWTLIEHISLSSSAASVTLGNGGTIPQTYKALKLVCSTRGTNVAVFDTLNIQFNNSTPNYSDGTITWRHVQGSGSAATSNSGSGTGQTITVGSTATSNTFGSTEFDIPNYSGSTNKPVSVNSVTENNATEAYQRMVAALWANTAAITSITCFPASSQTFTAGSTFTLYGLK